MARLDHHQFGYPLQPERKVVFQKVADFDTCIHCDWSCRARIFVKLSIHRSRIQQCLDVRLVRDHSELILRARRRAAIIVLSYRSSTTNGRLRDSLLFSDVAAAARHMPEAGAGFGDNSISPSPTFAASIDWRFRRISDEAFKVAVGFLLTEPPRKQVLRSGRVELEDSPPNKNLLKAQQALLMVRRIRNNLFHGAKASTPGYGDRERDIKLVQAGLVILNRCMLLNQDVHMAYETGTF